MDGSRRASVAALAGFVAGVVAGSFYWRRQVTALAARSEPYERSRATVSRPALIVNRWSGDGKAEQLGLAQAARRAGVRVTMLERGDDLTQLAHDAISAGADAVGMAGGDGSLGLVAAVAAERGVPFFCVPVGTRNHFALDLGLDRDDPLSALAALEGDEIFVDYGVAGSRAFLNNVSFGIYAQAVHRDGYRADKAATMAEVVSEATSSIENQVLLRYVTPDGQRHERAPVLLVSNNPYRYTGAPDYGRRLRLDSGLLGIGAVTSLHEAAASTDIRLDQLRSLHEWQATSFRVESDDPILAGVDGEALQFASPLTMSIRPKGLRVLVPRGVRPGYVPIGEALAAEFLDLAHLAGDPES